MRYAVARLGQSRACVTRSAHGETGYLVPHGDVEVLASRMLELAGDPELVARLGAGARAFAESLTWERAADETEAQLQAIIAGRPEAPEEVIMQTTITARHCEISDALRERALAVVERLGNIATRPMEASVVFDTDGQQQTAELRLHLATGDLLVAAARRPIIGARSTARRRSCASSWRRRAPGRPRRSRPSGANAL